MKRLISLSNQTEVKEPSNESEKEIAKRPRTRRSALSDISNKIVSHLTGESKKLKKKKNDDKVLFNNLQ